jgi:hypothetical protein
MWRATLATFLWFALASGHAAQPFLVPGALTSDCRSALRIGVVSCGGRTADREDRRAVSEAEVSQYLAQFGKPPREAVRALLDPSDANIAAWIRKQRQVVSIASYVATRMTEMQSQLEADFPPERPAPPSYLPAMMQMRATLFLSSADAPSLNSVRALQQLVARYPSIDGRLVQIGPPPEKQLSTWLAKLDTVLPVSTVSRGPLDDQPVPSLLIEDLRHGSSRLLDITDITSQQIRDQMTALRAVAEAHVQSSKRPESMQ